MTHRHSVSGCCGSKIKCLSMGDLPLRNHLSLFSLIKILWKTDFYSVSEDIELQLALFPWCTFGSTVTFLRIQHFPHLGTFLITFCTAKPPPTPQALLISTVSTLELLLSSWKRTDETKGWEYLLRLPILNVSAEQQTNSRPLVRPSSHIQALEWNGLSPGQWWAILREQALDKCQVDAQDWSFRVEAAPPPGKKGSCNQSTNVSLGPSSGHCSCQCSPFQTEPFTLEVPRGNPGLEKQKQLLMFGLQAFLYFSCLPYSPCSPSFSPLCSLTKVSLGLISWPGCWGWIWNLLKGP